MKVRHLPHDFRTRSSFVCLVFASSSSLDFSLFPVFDILYLGFLLKPTCVILGCHASVIRGQFLCSELCNAHQTLFLTIGNADYVPRPVPAGLGTLEMD